MGRNLPKGTRSVRASRHNTRMMEFGCYFPKHWTLTPPLRGWLSEGPWLPPCEKWTRSLRPFGQDLRVCKNWGPRAILSPCNSPIWRTITPKFGGHISLARGIFVPNFIVIAKSWRIPSHRTQNFGPHNSSSEGGRRVRLWGGVTLVQGQVPAKNELDRFTRLATIHACHKQTDRQRHHDNCRPIGFA